MKNKRGFTLVELLGAIVILALLSLIAIPAVTNSVKSNKQKLYDIQIKNIETAAKAWASDNLSELPEPGDSKEISLSELQKLGYADKNIKNPKTGKPLENFSITICNIDNQYTYKKDGNCEINTESDARLKVLTVDGTDVLTSKSISKPYGTTSVTVVAEANNSNATIKISGDDNLKTGKNTIYVEVTSENKTVTRTYEITVNVGVASNDATLKTLGLTGCTLSFNPNTTDYTCTLENNVTTTTVTATANDNKASVSGTGNKTLTVGNNEIKVTVTAEDGTTTKTYTVNVIRKKSSDATLSSLGLTDCELDPVFSSGTTSYSCTVENSVTSTTVSAAANDSKASVSGTGNKTLNVGDNTITVKVTAEDGTTKTYTVTVRRLSNDATLSDIKINGTSIENFSSNQSTYSLTLPYNTTSVTVETITNDKNAKVLMYLQPSGEQFETKKHQYEVTHGSYYTIAIVVFAEDKQFSNFNEVNIKVNSIFSYTENDDKSLTITGFADGVDTTSYLELTIPSAIHGSTVTAIGEWAFYSKNLLKVTIPDSVTTIQADAFGSNDLNFVGFSEGLKTIGNYAFANNNIENLSIPNSVDFIGYGAFNSNSLPDAQAFILARDGNNEQNSDIYGFSSDVTLVSYGGAATYNINIPENVTFIAQEAFSNTNINDIVIPETVTHIGSSAFTGNNLIEVNIPSSVTYIAPYAFCKDDFTSNSNLSTINNYTGYSFDWHNIISGEDGQDSFIGCPYNSVDDTCIINGVAIRNMNLEYIPDEDKFTYELDEANSTATITGFAEGYSTTVLNIPETLTIDGVSYTVNAVGEKYDNSCFDNSSNAYYGAFSAYTFDSITLPTTVKTIGDCAFANTTLSEIDLSSVSYIGNYAFATNNLVEIDLSSVSYIGNYAFFSNHLSETITLDSVSSMGIGAFKNNDISSVENHGGRLVYISSEAFENNSIYSIDLTTTIFSIGDSAFKDNLLESINIPNSYQPVMVGSYAFMNNKISSYNFESGFITYFDEINHIGIFNNNQLNTDSAYIYKRTAKDSSSLMNGYTEDTTILVSYGGTSRSDVAIPSTVQTISYRAFYGNELTSVTIPSNVITIEPYAFYDNLLSTITFEKISNITKFGDFALANQNAGVTVSLPDDPTDIGWIWEDVLGTTTDFPNSMPCNYGAGNSNLICPTGCRSITPDDSTNTYYVNGGTSNECWTS